MVDTTSTYQWYQTLKRPKWAPPSWVFGPVWTALYIIIAVSFGFVFYQIAVGVFAQSVAIPLVLNLIFNFAFTPLQFGLKSNKLAAVDILLVLATLLWTLSSIYPLVSWVALVNIPYLLWVCFATVLQLTITTLNWKTH